MCCAGGRVWAAGNAPTETCKSASWPTPAGRSQRTSPPTAPSPHSETGHTPTGLKSTATALWIQSVHINRAEIYRYSIMNPICTQQQDWNLQLEHHEYNLYTATGVRSTATSGIQSVRINRAEIYSYSIRNPTCTHQQGWNLQLGHHESSLYISTGVKSTARVSWIQSVHINRSEIYSQCVMNPICDIHPCFTFGWSWFWKTNIEVWTEWNKCIHTIQYYTVRLVFRVVRQHTFNNTVISLSLSLYIYIYIYIYTHTHTHIHTHTHTNALNIEWDIELFYVLFEVIGYI